MTIPLDRLHYQGELLYCFHNLCFADFKTSAIPEGPVSHPATGHGGKSTNKPVNESASKPVLGLRHRATAPSDTGFCVSFEEDFVSLTFRAFKLGLFFD